MTSIIRGLSVWKDHGVHTVGVGVGGLDDHPDRGGAAVGQGLVVALVGADEDAPGGQGLEVACDRAVHQARGHAIGVLGEGDAGVLDGPGEVEGRVRRGAAAAALAGEGQAQAQEGRGPKDPEESSVQRHGHLDAAKRSSLARRSLSTPRGSGEAALSSNAAGGPEVQARSAIGISGGGCPEPRSARPSRPGSPLRHPGPAGDSAGRRRPGARSAGGVPWHSRSGPPRRSSGPGGRCRPHGRRFSLAWA